MSDAQPPAPGLRNEVLAARAHQHSWSGVGALSIKTFAGGAARYRTGSGACHVVDQHSYLILNHAQPYSIEIDAAAPVESFCVFFACGLAEQVCAAGTQDPARLIDSPPSPTGAIQFFDRTYAHDKIVSPTLKRLRARLACGPVEQGWLDEQCHDLLGQMLHVHAGCLAESARLDALRPATRIELYRRLHLARDYADALCAGPLTLNDLAQVAGLSPNHLLRTFRQLFAQTPYQYITARRLELARRLLAETNDPVSAVALDVGFESLGSFSWLFRRRVGVSPLAYRRRFR